MIQTNKIKINILYTVTVYSPCVYMTCVIYNKNMLYLKALKSLNNRGLLL